MPPLFPCATTASAFQVKNYRPLAGKPLFQHIIETLLAVPEIDTVMVDTDLEPVMDGVRRLFPAVRLIQRPGHLRADDVPMNDILPARYGAGAGGLYLQTHSTNPLLKTETISKGIKTFFEAFPKYDPLFL
ncbi:hypothetical protein [Candidatus Villigracilis saccharophilus]|uniref:cytidylyltransferase domain-containing protein n=1 Tax=Candidatus Villigracilis saccharophilus TaxID=3140684 RepID=UPI0031EAF9FF